MADKKAVESQGSKEPHNSTTVIPGLGLQNAPPPQSSESASNHPSHAPSADGASKAPPHHTSQTYQHHHQPQQQQGYGQPSHQQQQSGQPWLQQQQQQQQQMAQMMPMRQLLQQQQQQMMQMWQLLQQQGQQQGQHLPFSPQQPLATPVPTFGFPGAPLFPNMPVPPFPMPFAAPDAAVQSTDASKPKPPRQQPSEASGGVPEPTAEYLEQASNSFDTTREPRRLLLVIDLNGTLLFRPNHRRPSDFVLRPHAATFMRYCLDNFFVVIWSSARPDNVRRMVDQLLTPEQLRRCVLVWARDKLGLSPADYDSKVQCYKRLTAVWADPAIQEAHPDDGGRWDQSNTVLLDDSPEKGRTEPYNILALPEFEGLAGEPPDVLTQVHDYLNDLSYRSDVSCYMRQRPFQLSASFALPP